jgi:hypothetical protein
MPLMKGKSPKAFEKNVKTEMHEGKPLKQSLAIAYSMKRKAKKMAEGGQITDNYQSSENPHKKDGLDFLEDEKAHGYVEHEGDVKRPDHEAMMEDDRDLNQHGEHEEGPQGGGEGFHGEEYMDHHHDPHDMYSDTEDGDGLDMVGRIMKQRQMMYSEGGRVANEGEDMPSHLAKYKENEFDVLPMEDDLESEYTGANSGDELGDAREDHDRADIVARIMASRRKRDRMPSPA